MWCCYFKRTDLLSNLVFDQRKGRSTSHPAHATHTRLVRLDDDHFPLHVLKIRPALLSLTLSGYCPSCLFHTPPPSSAATPVMMTTAFPLSRSAKVAVSTHPANEWGPDETLHAWEIVMFKDL